MAVLERFYCSWVWFGYFSSLGREIKFYLFGKELISCLSHANLHAFHENPDCIYTELTFAIPYKAYQKSLMLLSSAEIFEATSTNSVYPDQTAPVEAV